MVVTVDATEEPSLDPPTPTSEASTYIATPPRSSSVADQRPDTPAEHYTHAQQALALAAQGGLVTALNSQEDIKPLGEPSESEKRIGRSLFIALDLVTFEKDESVVLEIGWSAQWWQPKDPEQPEGEWDEMSSQGHYMLASVFRHFCKQLMKQSTGSSPEAQEWRKEAESQRQLPVWQLTSNRGSRHHQDNGQADF